MTLRAHSIPAGSRPPGRAAGLVRSEGRSQLNSRGRLSFWDILRKRKRMILAMTFVGLLGAGAACLLLPPLYSPRATLEVLGLNERSMNLGEVDPQGPTGGYLVAESNIQTQIEILQSATLKRQVIERADREAPSALPTSADVLASVRSRLGIVPQDPIAFTRDSIQSCSTTLLAKPVRASRIVEIRCDAQSPEVAANFLNLLVATYTEQGSASRVQGAQKMGQGMTGRLEEAKSRLEASEEALEGFLEANGLPKRQEQETLTDARLKQLQVDLATAQSERISKQSLRNLVQSTPPEQLPENVADSSLKEAQILLEQLQRQKAELLASYTPAHPRIKMLDQLLADARTSLQQNYDALAERTKTDYEAAGSRERMLMAAISKQRRMVAAQSDKRAEFHRLKREVETNTQIYSNLEQNNTAKAAPMIPTAHVRVVDPATPPLKPAKPDYLVLLGAGSMIGLLGGCFAGLFRERGDTIVRSPRFASGLLRLKELAVIPSSEENGRGWSLRRLAASIRRRNGDEEREEASGVLVATEGRFSHAAESYRAALRGIAVEDENGYRPVVVGITSPNSKEGKSTVTSNLAVVLAEVFPRVLVIDGDVRKPRQYQLFKTPEDPGLVEILQSSKPIPLYPAEELTQETEFPGVRLLPSGKVGARVGHLFYSPRLRTLIARFRQEHDVVLLDTAPVLCLSDTCLLGQLVDGMILVLRSGKTDSSHALAARQRLAEEGIPIIGTILTDWDPSSTEAEDMNRYFHA